MYSRLIQPHFILAIHGTHTMCDANRKVLNNYLTSLLKLQHHYVMASNSNDMLMAKVSIIA